jgi:hypothetical protein
MMMTPRKTDRPYRPRGTRKLQANYSRCARAPARPTAPVSPPARSNDSVDGLLTFDGICVHVQTGLTKSRAEGLNRKVRVVTSRTFGFQSAKKIHLAWPHVSPT